MLHVVHSLSGLFQLRIFQHGNATSQCPLAECPGDGIMLDCCSDDVLKINDVFVRHLNNMECDGFRQLRVLFVKVSGDHRL